MKKKEFIIILSIIILILLGIFLINKLSNTETEDQKQIDAGTPANPISTKKVTEKFEMYNTNIKSEHGKTELKATVKNITNARTEEQKVTIVLIDENKNEIGQLIAVIPSLDSGKSTTIATENMTEYENIYDFKIR